MATIEGKPEQATPGAAASPTATQDDGPRADAAQAAGLNGQTGADQQAAGQQASVRVPDRPQLAPGVKLAGQLRESAFKNPPWLIEREDSGYVQVTELLYRIAEACDGQRDLAEIAKIVSEKTGRSVSPDNVRVLVGTQLLLKGLVPAADGRVVGSAGNGRSLLALSLRTKMIEPALLDGPARLLSWLFWPPILVSIVVAALAALGWLLLVHGLAAGARQALYTPGLLLIALALTALAAGFHELGHAAALVYGGGRPKGMGVGIYLVYPAFYTDVSDNYRLTRWGRVRTDLGGVFFHLVFVLGIIALYLMTGWEMLLFAVPLLLLDAFRQLLPMIRLDGYWTLADLTGVPDFLSYIGAFVRKFIPGKADEPSKLPELKWWGTLAFAAYIIVIVPLLLFMLFTMVRTVPTVLATAWDSARQLLGQFGEARGQGSVLGMVSAVAQLAILSLPTAGLIYSLVRFGKRIALAIWTWSKPTPTRRVVGGLGTLGALALVGYLWAPQLPFGIGRPGPLYGPTQASFVPIAPEARGTVFDAVSTVPLDPPAPAPAVSQPMPAPSPSPNAGSSGVSAPSSSASPAPVAPDAAATASPVPASAATPTRSAPSGVPTMAAPSIAPPAGRQPALTTTPTPSAAITVTPSGGTAPGGTGTAIPTRQVSTPVPTTAAIPTRSALTPTVAPVNSPAPRVAP